jgi:hypothetical protein
MEVIIEHKALTGDYKHVRFSKIIKVKQIVGSYALLEDDNEKQVVIRKEDLFDNYNKIKKEEEFKSLH